MARRERAQVEEEELRLCLWSNGPESRAVDARFKPRP